MLRIERHGDVARVHLWSRSGRAVGYDVSAYLVRGVLIDTGFPRAAGALDAWLADARVDAAVLTHHHEDHGGNAERLARRGIPVAMAAATERALRALVRVPLYRTLIWGAVRPFRAPVERTVPAGLELIATPGHSADHHAVWDPSTGTLFGGDLFIGVKVRLTTREEDPRAHVAALRAAAARRPARLFDAHRGPVADPAAALAAKADWMAARIAEVDARIARGDPDRAIVREVLGGEDPAALVSRGDYSHLNFVRALRRTYIR